MTSPEVCVVPVVERLAADDARIAQALRDMGVRSRHRWSREMLIRAGNRIDALVRERDEARSHLAALTQPPREAEGC